MNNTYILFKYFKREHGLRFFLSLPHVHMLAAVYKKYKIRKFNYNENYVCPCNKLGRSVYSLLNPEELALNAVLR